MFKFMISVFCYNMNHLSNYFELSHSKTDFILNLLVFYKIYNHSTTAIFLVTSSAIKLSSLDNI